MDDILIATQEMGIDSLIALWTSYVGLSAITLTLIGFMSWAFWYLIRSFKSIVKI